MKKIALIVVIVASVISLALVWKVDDMKKKHLTQIAQLTDDLNGTKGNLDKTKKQLATTETERDQVRAKLADTDEKLAAANTTIEEKTKTVAGLETKVAEADKRTSEAMAKVTETEGILNKIKAALQIEDVTNLEQLGKRVTAQADENKLLGEQIAKLHNVIATQEELLRTPEGVRGKVAVVEDKWGFLVLNIGSVDKVHKGTDFLVYRDTQLIGKAQITYVGTDTSIAQMQPEYRRGVARVGDLAIH